MLCSLQSHNSSIKQETSNELSFSDKFIHIMRMVQNQSSVTKDLVLEYIQLFYQNNALFVQLFEASFLLIFKTFSSQASRLNKIQGQAIIDKYSDFLKNFLGQMINMEVEVKKTAEEQEFFENFVDFYLTFFGQALASAKSFTKEFSFTILISSLKVIDDSLEVELLSQTQQKLFQACIYLLGSNFEDYKLMGVQLYQILRKIKVTSVQVEEFLFQILESHKNYQLRKLIILDAVSLKSQKNTQRLLNRLRDKNPFIVETVLVKVINEKVKFQDLRKEHKQKILIDGACSYHPNVRQKSFQFIGLSFKRIINLQTVKKIQRLSEQIQKQQNGLEVFLNLFNSDQFLTQQVCPKKHSLILEQIWVSFVSTLCLSYFPQFLKSQIKRIFRKIEISKIANKQSAFLYFTLKKVCQDERQGQNLEIFQQKRKELRNFINSADFLPNFQETIRKLRSLYKYGKYQFEQIQNYGIVLKIIEILVLKFDVTDLSGKLIIQEELKKLILEFDFSQHKSSGIQGLEDVLFNDQNQQIESQIEKLRYLQRQMRKLDSLLGNQTELIKDRLPVVSNPFDILSLAVNVFLNLSQNNITNHSIQLKMPMNQLLDNKQLSLQFDINTKILNNTLIEIQKAENDTQENKKPLNNLLIIKLQLQKRLLENKKKANNNQIKAFTILTTMLCFQYKNHNQRQSLNIKASQYIEFIKKYLYRDQQRNFYKITDTYNISLTTNFMVYTLIYFYCLQSEDNYKSFQKLFFYYAFEQDQTVLKQNTRSMLTKLINLRLLSELQIKYSSQSKNNQELNHASIHQKTFQASFVSLLVQNLLDSEKRQNLNEVEKVLTMQILLQTLISQRNLAKNKILLTNLIFIAFKQYYSNLQNNQWMKKIMLNFEKLSSLHQNQLFQSLICIYYSLITCLYQNSNKWKSNSKAFSLMNDIVKFFTSFLKIANTKNNIYQRTLNQGKWFQRNMLKFCKNLLLQMKFLQKFPQSIEKISFLNLNKILTLFEIQNQGSFSKNQKILGSEQMHVQLLIFTKRKVQKFLDFCKLKQNQIFQKSKHFVNEISWFEQIDRLLKEQITKKLLQKNDHQYDQQSTDNSPAHIFQNKNDSNSQKININLIHSYEGILQKELKLHNLEMKNIIAFVRKINIFDELISLNKQNAADQPVSQISQVQKKDENSSQIVVGKNPSELSFIFDRRGRRKDNPNYKKLMADCFEVKASIKKNHYLIIPYEIIEKSQNFSKKIKHHKKKLYKQSGKTERYLKQLNQIDQQKIQDEQISRQNNE